MCEQGCMSATSYMWKSQGNSVKLVPLHMGPSGGIKVPRLALLCACLLSHLVSPHSISMLGIVSLLHH